MYSLVVCIKINRKGGESMKRYQLLIRLPPHLKKFIETKRQAGYTANGYVQALLERELNQPTTKKGR